MRSLLAGLLAFALLAPSFRAQETLQVHGPSPATVVLGSSARIDFVVEGRSGNPQTPRVPPVDGLSYRLNGPSRQVYTSITGAGMVEQVSTTYQLLVTPQREGSFTIPSFTMQTGTRQQTVAAMQLTAVKELRGAEFGYLDVRVEPRRVYVHEPIRVRVEFGVDKGLRPVQNVANGGARYWDLDVQAGWLSDMPGAETLPVPDPTGDSAPIVLNSSRLQRAEYDSAHEREGRTYNSFVFHKAFLPTRPGKVTLDAPLLRYQILLREGRRGLFGERTGGQSQNYFVYGKPIDLEVLPIPTEGRPSPYYGAVGRFTITAEVADPTVKVGGSVKLVLHIRGSGNFEFLRVPDLSSLERHGLHLLGQTEQRDAEQLTVTYDLTPLRADVTEVPGIAWNYFDTTPGVERFVEVATEPLPLDVQPLADGGTLAPLPEDRTSVTPGVDDIFDLKPLDGPPRPRPQLSRTWVLVAVGLPWLLLLLFTAVRGARRRALRDPGAVRRRNAARTCERALASGTDPVQALCGYLADRLDVPAAAVVGPDLGARLRDAGLDDELAAEVAQTVEQGVAGRYGGQGGVDAARVRELVARLEPAQIRRTGSAALAIVICAALAAAAPAQQDEGYRAYRAGDYQAAAAAFERATERRDDRRLWFARGNCYYRLGDLPRALWAYECAQLGMPRDEELAANLDLVRRKLQLDSGSGEAFAAAVAALRDRFTAPELTWVCGLCMTLAALGLLRWRRSAAARWLFGIMIVPGTLLALELLWLRPSRPQRAVALHELQLLSEPRAGTPKVATVAAGVTLTLRSGERPIEGPVERVGEWVRVDAGDRSGYAKSADIAVVQ